MLVRPGRRWSWQLLVLSAVMLGTGACGEGPDQTGFADEPAADDAGGDEADEIDDADAAEDRVRLEVADGELGGHLVDGKGMTVYLFTPDEGGESTCTGGCAENWPPVAGDHPDAGRGVDAALVGTTDREDGSTQLTYNGWPLYYFSGDESAGDAAGQGINDAWFVVGPDGEPIENGAGDTGASGPEY